MARIRSIHPGIFTDEGFMSLSMEARQMLIGIWCEAFDDGIFEWKPLTLKARIFPVDNVDVDNLLAELEDGNFIKSFKFGEKRCGAIRDFRKFQRPKKPNKSDMLPDDLRTYVGLKGDGPEPITHQLPTNSEKSQQMEDGGCSKEGNISSLRSDSCNELHMPDEEKEISQEPSSQAKSLTTRFEEFWEAYNYKKGKAAAIKVWKRLKLDNKADAVIAGAKAYAANRGNDQKFWKHPQGWLNDGRWEDNAPQAEPPKTTPEQDKKRRMRLLIERGHGREHWCLPWGETPSNEEFEREKAVMIAEGIQIAVPKPPQFNPEWV